MPGKAAAILAKEANIWRRVKPRELQRSLAGTHTNHSWGYLTSIVSLSQAFLVLKVQGILNNTLSQIYHIFV